MSDAVVITGLGTVGPHGAGRAALEAGLAEGRAVLSAVDRSGGFHLEDSARLAGRVDPRGLDDWVARGAARRMSLPSRCAVAAARMALADAGLEPSLLAGRDVAVAVGTAFGPNEFAGRLLEHSVERGPAAASPLLFMEAVSSVHAGQVALDLRLAGPNATVVLGEASGLAAVAQAFACVRSGRASLALAGSTEETGGCLHAVLDRFGALSRSERGRAFDAERDGFVISDGATLLVLEREADARARGAPVLARLAAAVRAHDPSASASGWGREPDRLARALRRGLARAGAAGEGFDRFVSGASGSRGGDRLEARLLHALHPAGDLPPVLAPKACTGEYGGGFLAAAALSLSELPFGPTPGFERVDPELGVRPHDGRRLPAPRRALVSSLAAGGAAVWLALEAV